MLKAYLMENYGYNEPIFIKELSIDGLSQNAVRQSVKRLTAIGFLERYDNGIYYIPEDSVDCLEKVILIQQKLLCVNM